MILNKIQNGDAIELLKTVPDNSVDLILTDPPYNLNYKSRKGSDLYKQRVQNAQEWDNNFDITPYIKEFFRIAKNNAYILIFGCEENIAKMQELGCHQILVWDKKHIGMGNLNDWGIGYEFIFYFKKGSPKLQNHRINGVLNIPFYGLFSKTLHPTQKPIQLITYIIKNTSKENDIVLDCFMGSGTTAVACKQTGRNYIGMEKQQKYCDIIEKRLREISQEFW